jgi:hypothetical protein
MVKNNSEGQMAAQPRPRKPRDDEVRLTGEKEEVERRSRVSDAIQLTEMRLTRDEHLLLFPQQNWLRNL